MWIFLVWIALCAVAAVIAHNKGRSPTAFFALAFVLSPLVGIIAALVSGSNVRELERQRVAAGDSKKCPSCAELIKREAKVCRYCGHVQAVPDTAVLDAQHGGGINRFPEADKQLDRLLNAGIWLLVGLGLIGVLVIVLRRW